MMRVYRLEKSISTATRVRQLFRSTSYSFHHLPCQFVLFTDYFTDVASAFIIHPSQTLLPQVFCRLEKGKIIKSIFRPLPLT